MLNGFQDMLRSSRMPNLTDVFSLQSEGELCQFKNFQTGHSHTRQSSSQPMRAGYYNNHIAPTALLGQIWFSKRN